MARKKRDEERDERRLSRKEILIARHQRQRTRQIRLAVGLVATLLVLVFLVAVVVEGYIRPNQPVAEVNGTEIRMNEWQERVRFQRAQFIIALEDQLESFGGDVGLVQQFNQQQISLLQQPELLGELVLEQMVNEVLVSQAAAQRGIEVTEEEVEERIAEGFSYFGGESPTPFPTPTQTVMPTPSLTPFPTAVVTEALPVATAFPTPTQGPTSTPLPTPTPVSEEAYREELTEFLDRFDDMGVDEETYRDVVRASLFRDRLAEALAEEAELGSEAEHASLYVLSFDSEGEAERAAGQIAQESFLEVWNRMRSLPDDEAGLSGTASEVLWQTADRLEQRFGSPELAEAAFEMDLEEPSDVISATPVDPATGSAGEPVYYIIMVSGREMRELPETTIDTRQQELVSELVQVHREDEDVTILESWRNHAPTQPVLDLKFLQQPTPAPDQLPLGTPETGTP